MVLIRTSHLGDPRAKTFKPPPPRPPYIPLESDIWREGCAAYQAGVPYEQFPYREGTHQHDSWHSGYCAAEVDATEPDPSTIDDDPSIPF